MIIIEKIINESPGSMEFTGQFGVDAGNICFIDSSLAKKNGGSWTKSAQTNNEKFQLTPGKYEISYMIPRTYSGAKSGKFIINIPSGELWVGDIGYFWSTVGMQSNPAAAKKIDDAWEIFLEKTGYMKNLSKFGGKYITTGGDGMFKVSFYWKPATISAKK